MWDEQLLIEGLGVVYTMQREQLAIIILQLLVSVLGEVPARVRQLLEQGHLNRIVTKLQELLLTTDRNSMLFLGIVNFLITLNPIDEATNLALLHTTDSSRDGLIKQVFNKCYLPSEDLSEMASKEEFTKRVITLYSSSSLAKCQVEKVIEQMFVKLGSLVDLGQEKIEEIVSQKERLKQFYTYSKSLQGVLGLFEKQHSERRSYRQQGYEEMQLEENQRSKD